MPQFYNVGNNILMIETQENLEKATQYLFGELGETERDTLEERIFTDEDFSLFVDSLEKDLIDDYIRGEMDFALRQRFEKKYLTLESRREKVQTARILYEELFTEKPRNVVGKENPKLPFWQSLTEIFLAPNFALAGSLAILLFALIGGWLLFRNQSSNNNLLVKDDNKNVEVPLPTPDISPINQSSPPTNQSEVNINKPVNNGQITPTPKKSEKEKSEKESQPVQPQPKIFAFTLFPVVRSGERPTLNLPNSAETVNLQVVHDNQKEFAKYRAELRNENGVLISRREIVINEKNLTRPVNLSVKNSSLKSGAYELTLSGVTEDEEFEEIKFYNFTVKKK